jgi:hypothetical protein
MYSSSFLLLRSTRTVYLSRAGAPGGKVTLNSHRTSHNAARGGEQGPPPLGAHSSIAHFSCLLRSPIAWYQILTIYKVSRASNGQKPESASRPINRVERV